MPFRTVYWLPYSDKVSFTTERIKQTVSIDATTVDIEEKGVKLRLTVVDTPGFGDAVDNRAWYIKSLVSHYS